MPTGVFLIKSLKRLLESWSFHEAGGILSERETEEEEEEEEEEAAAVAAVVVEQNLEPCSFAANISWNFQDFTFLHVQSWLT
ncbi:hypothetical protein LOK49_LG08G02913 [Camellia lanceoleosa]|uniref:Uncharacterized protein n=1 Tax=Camellia lanceoleosa TaxID=1840588 RepID=A0ACC0GS47_9ERIC|nr:hypothetical protein LOK49_LG08G02913 [Camellia lanceoleosa]